MKRHMSRLVIFHLLVVVALLSPKTGLQTAVAGSAGLGSARASVMGSPPRAVRDSGPSEQKANPGSEVLLDTFNTAATLNRPKKSATFTIGRSYRVTLIQTYHWNGGRGAEPGTVSLKHENEQRLGPWQCIGSKGSGSVPCYWTCHPNTVLPEGTYKVLVSPSETWSYNAESDGRGFVRIEGIPVETAGGPEAIAGTEARFTISPDYA